MRIRMAAAGFSMKDADAFRRAMAKKIPEQLELFRERFIRGAVAHGISKTDADRIYETALRSAEYTFNKSHAVAYGLVAYWTAYLKANYYEHYMAALLTSESYDADRRKEIIRECKKRGVRIQHLDVEPNMPY